jgi:hypothetical protein
MNVPQYSRYDWLLQAIVIPIYIGVLNWALIGPVYWQNWFIFGVATLIASCFSFVGWLINNVAANSMHRRYPRKEQYRQRLTRQTILCICDSSLNTILLFFLYRFIAFDDFQPPLIRLALGLSVTLTVVALVLLAYESIHSFDHWQESEQTVETLSKAQLRAQLDALRQQVNPHFLFNSLNSLISLIDENPHQAGMFAEELSSVYRYLLRANELPLTSLAAELDFVQSYYHLLKTRHGDSLTLITRIQPGLEDRKLPPLTLQLLIENAVKHNVILPEQTLTISLTTDEQQRLTVSNNLQRKPGNVLSNGIGLSNILHQYRMLGQPTPVIEDDGETFRVTLALVVDSPVNPALGRTVRSPWQSR